MKENEDKNFEQYVQAVIKEAPLESPSPDFTAKVMTGVFAFERSKATVYKPLISKKGWALIFGGIVAALGYFIMNGHEQDAGQQWWAMPGAYFSKMFADSHLFQLSRTTINIIFLSSILMIIQITLLKNYLHKRVAT